MLSALPVSALRDVVPEQEGLCEQEAAQPRSTQRKSMHHSSEDECEEDAAVRKQGRGDQAARLRNREAQRRFRARQKVLISELKDQLAVLHEQVDQQAREIQVLKQENAALRSGGYCSEPPTKLRATEGTHLPSSSHGSHPDIAAAKASHEQSIATKASGGSVATEQHGVVVECSAPGAGGPPRGSGSAPSLDSSHRAGGRAVRASCSNASALVCGRAGATTPRVMDLGALVPGAHAPPTTSPDSVLQQATSNETHAPAQQQQHQLAGTKRPHSIKVVPLDTQPPTQQQLQQQQGGAKSCSTSLCHAAMGLSTLVDAAAHVASSHTETCQLQLPAAAGPGGMLVLGRNGNGHAQITPVGPAYPCGVDPTGLSCASGMMALDQRGMAAMAAPGHMAMYTPEHAAMLGAMGLVRPHVVSMPAGSAGMLNPGAAMCQGGASTSPNMTTLMIEQPQGGYQLVNVARPMHGMHCMSVAGLGMTACMPLGGMGLDGQAMQAMGGLPMGMSVSTAMAGMGVPSGMHDLSMQMPGSFPSIMVVPSMQQQQQQRLQL